MSALAKFLELYKSGAVSASTIVKAAAFKDELEKQAGPGAPPVGMDTFLRYLATGLAVSAGLGLATAGAKIGVQAIEKYQMESKRDELFEDMVRLHPDLSGENRKRAKLYLNCSMRPLPCRV